MKDENVESFMPSIELVELEHLFFVHMTTSLNLLPFLIYLEFSHGFASYFLCCVNMVCIYRLPTRGNIFGHSQKWTNPIVELDF